MPSLEKLITARKNGTCEDDLKLITRAYRFAEAAHEGQKRKSGIPYFTHPFETARTVASWGLDAAVIAAALLHDVPEDTGRTLEEIKKSFGEEIAFLVDGVTKLGRFKYREKEAGKEDAEKVDNFRKMILALSEDLRVIFIKLADRLHNMQTLSALPPQKQARIARETFEIYAPLAYRLGMMRLAGELEDLALPYLHPEDYKWLLAHVPEKFEAREAYLEKVKVIIERELGAHGIGAAIHFRAKRYASLHKKLKRYDMEFEHIYDLVAMRIIVKTVEECYRVLGLIHALYPPLPGRIKDYIALPKPNGYQSLHTTVFCEDKKIIEFQIRTERMHEEAEHGIAAHWAYEEAKGEKGYLDRRAVLADKKEVAWIRQMQEWQKNFGASDEEFLSSLKVDFFRDRIFVVTPKGDVIDLPDGATPVDFAYNIHSDIGSQCVAAKVNGRIAPLDRPLRSGDIVTVITQKGKKPSEDWLGFVKTSIARDHIKKALKAKKTLLEKRPRRN